MFFNKTIQNDISRKLPKLEQSYLEAKLATPESTLTAPNYRVRYFKF